MEEFWLKIKKMIDSNSIDSIVEMCEKMPKSEFEDIKNKLIQELRITGIITHRNTIAIVLSDLRCNEAIDVFVDLINDPANKNCRGTLIYALQELKCEGVIKKLMPALFDGNLEVKCNMYDLLSEKVKYMSEIDQIECLNILKEEKRKLEEELELLEDVEKIFLEEK